MRARKSTDLGSYSLNNEESEAASTPPSNTQLQRRRFTISHFAYFKTKILEMEEQLPSLSDRDRYCYKPILSWNSQVEQYFIRAYGADHFSRITKALTHPSSYSCIRVNYLRSTSDAVIGKLIATIQNTQFTTDIDRGTPAGQTKHIASEEATLDPLIDTNGHPSIIFARDAEMPTWRLENPCIRKCSLPGMDYVLFVKGSGPHTLHYGDCTSQPQKEVIVSRKCAEAVLRGAQVFVPGVLACSSHVEKGDKVAISVAVEQPGSDREWSVGITRGTTLDGSHADPLYAERKGLYIGQGTAMMSRAGIFRAHVGIAVELTNRVYQLPSFHDVLKGEIFLQNFPSIIAVHALDPQEGERILDMCAAPGGKTTAIAILMKDKGEVIATDRSHNKVMDILKLASEMGLTCISAYKLDALKAVRRSNEDLGTCAADPNKDRLYDSTKKHKTRFQTKDKAQSAENCINTTLTSSEETCKCCLISCMSTDKNNRQVRNGPGRNNCVGSRVEKSKGFLPNTFDRVLVDAPCSALGLRPRLFAGEETLESLVNYAKYQRKMFDQAVELVRPGGVLVYSTCTINPGENEALVRYALDTYKFLSLSEQRPRIGGPGLVGHCQTLDGSTERWLTPGESKLVQRFDPASSLDTIGFFIAKFSVGRKDG